MSTPTMYQVSHFSGQLPEVIGDHDQLRVEPVYEELGHPSCRIQLHNIKKDQKQKRYIAIDQHNKNERPDC